MAEELNRYFSSVFTREGSTANIPVGTQHRVERKLIRLHITTEIVRKKLKDLRTTAAAGPDGISPRILKETAREIAPLLAHVYRQSLTDGVVPKDWKGANVTPIYRTKRDRNQRQVITVQSH